MAWSSVQLICQCSVSESRVQLPRTQIMSAEEASSTGCDTSFVPNKGTELSHSSLFTDVCMELRCWINNLYKFSNFYLRGEKMSSHFPANCTFCTAAV